MLGIYSTTDNSSATVVSFCLFIIIRQKVESAIKFKRRERLSAAEGTGTDFSQWPCMQTQLVGERV